MNVLITLLRKHFIETRWMLGVSSLAFFAIGVLTTWMTWRFETRAEAGEISLTDRRYGFLRALGGPAQDYSTTGLEVCWWNHPVLVLTILAWAVTRASATVAGEIERGTVDVTLSRPVSRSNYLTSQILFAILGLVAMAGALLVATMLGGAYYGVKTPPSLVTLLRPAAMIVTLGMAVYGYTVPFSAIDVVRWRPNLIGATITLAGLIALSVANQFPDYEKVLQKLSVFQVYAPVTVALKGEPLAYNTSVLLGVFAVGIVATYPLFLHRDIPSNS
jgi:ABC-2 type transport system permease protein